jgi:hypothetical protein
VASRREGKAARARPADPARRRMRRRALVAGAIVAAVLGFGVGWLVRALGDRSPEQRARETVDDLRERARKAAH